MRYRYFVGIEHQKVHYRFLHSVLGGDYVTHPCGENERSFPQEILDRDGKDVIWFFSDLYYRLHPLLKGKQVLSKHGLCFGKWLTPRRADCINNYMDAVLQPGATQESNYKQFSIKPEKIKRLGYTLLFEIPDQPTRENAILFSSTCFRHWSHYDNMAGILRSLDPSFEGYLSIHPQTPSKPAQLLLDACAKQNHISLIQSQDELLKAFAHCAINVSGGLSSVGSPFWFLKKPVIFVRGRVGINPLKGLGWQRIKKESTEPLFRDILDESTKISDWRQLTPQIIRRARPASSADKVFYPWNRSRAETEEKLKQYVSELEAIHT